jgi:hypothetical protein
VLIEHWGCCSTDLSLLAVNLKHVLEAWLKQSCLPFALRGIVFSHAILIRQPRGAAACGIINGSFRPERLSTKLSTKLGLLQETSPVLHTLPIRIAQTRRFPLTLA